MAFLIVRMNGGDRDSSRMTPVGKIVRRHEHIALADAHAMIEQARADAARIVKQAHDAYQAERERGYADGMQAARVDQAAVMLGLSEQTSEYLKRVEADLVDLVGASLRRIVADFDASERVLAVVRSGLALVRQQKQVLLRVHTEDAAIVRQNMQALLAQFPSVDFLDVVADDRFERGACRVETGIGTIETSLGMQLDILQAALRQAFPDASRRSADPVEVPGEGGCA
jgi:type III secretion protein L